MRLISAEGQNLATEPDPAIRHFEVRDPIVRNLLALSVRLHAARPAGSGPTFGTAEFQAATQLAQHASSHGWPRAVVSALAGGGRSTRALWTLITLPAVTIALTPAEGRAWRADPFPPAARSIFQGYIGQAVLALEEDDDVYLSGRHRRQLRTRLRRAYRDGIRPVVFDTYEEWFQVARPVLDARPGGPEETARMRPPDPCQAGGYFAALDDLGFAAAIGAVAVFSRNAMVFSLVGNPAHGGAGEARYLLHDFMRSNLRDRGIRYLITGSALRLPEGLQLFQDLLGYEVCNLRIAEHRSERVS